MQTSQHIVSDVHLAALGVFSGSVSSGSPYNAPSPIYPAPTVGEYGLIFFNIIATLQSTVAQTVTMNVFNTADFGSPAGQNFTLMKNCDVLTTAKTFIFSGCIFYRDTSAPTGFSITSGTSTATTITNLNIQRRRVMFSQNSFAQIAGL